MSKLVLVAVLILAAGGFITLRSLETRVTDALSAQRRVNLDLEASLIAAGVPLPKRIAFRESIPLPPTTQAARSRPVATSAGGSGASVGNSSSSRHEVVIEQPAAGANDAALRDRDGRVVIPSDDKLDTDEDSAPLEPRITPAPPPPRPVIPQLPPGRAWGKDDPNFEFKSDKALPTIGVITLNAQASAGGGIGLAQKSSWMHRMSYNNKAAYCKKWGYDLIIEDNSIIDQSRDVAWSKIPIFKKWLPKYQWLMWVDMDAFFMRFDLPITDLANNDVDLVIAKDWHGINFGVFLIRNSPWAYTLLDKMWNSPQSWWKPWEEQSALMALTDPKKNPQEAYLLLEHIKFPRQRELNSYGAEFAYGNLQALYRTGDRIVHFPNCKGFRTCRNTIENFYRTMLTDSGIEDMESADVPASQFPEY